MRSPEKTVLCTICLLILSKSYADHGWKPRKEHMFALDGRTVAGIPSLGQQQHSGIRYRGILRVQTDNSGLFLKLQNMTYTKLHENLPEGWWSNTDNARENFRELPITSSTIAVRLSRHGVESVSFKTGLDDWEMNLIQGIVNQLQIDLKFLKKDQKGKRNQINASYKMMENSVFGRCEVLYEVTRIPRSVALARAEWFPSADICGNMNFVEIFKTRNLTNCEYSAEFHFGLPASKECHPGGNMCQDFWKRVSITRLSGCGDQNDFRILQTETNSRVLVNLHLHGESEASVSSYITMNLISMKETSRRFSPPADPIVSNELKFKFTHANGHKDTCPLLEEMEKYYPRYTEETTNITPSASTNKGATNDIPTSMNATNLNTTQPEVSNKERNQWELGLLGLHNPPHQPLIPNALGLQGSERSFQQIQKLKETITDVATDFEESTLIHEKMTLEKVLVAVRICRTMTLFDLKRAVSSVNFQPQNNKQQLTESKVYRDVMVMCGTNPAFHILRTWIEQKDLRGEEANQVMVTMPAHLQTPGPDIVRKFYDMIQSMAVREDPQLKTTSILAFSHLLRIACVDSRSRYAQYTDETFDATCERHHASEYISWFTSMLRSDASLRRVYVAALGNTGAVAALGPLKAFAEDATITPYLRATAILAMKYQALSFPEQTSKILFSLYHDVGQPVAVRVAAVSLLFYTRPQLVLLQRIAVLTWYDPSLAVAAFVRSSLVSLANLKDPLLSVLSRYARMVLSLVNPVPLGLHKSHNVMWSTVSGSLQEIVFNQLLHETSLDATNFYYRYTHRLEGVSRVAFQGDLFVSNPDQFLTLLRELIHPRPDTLQARPAIENIERHTSWLRKNLNIAQRTLPKFEGDFRIQFGKLMERIFPFDKKLLVELSKAGRNLVEQMKTGKDFHYQKIDKTTIRTAVVTELGFPINFDLSVPWAFRLVGNAKMDVENKVLEMHIDMTYTSHLLSELCFYTTWDETVHMAASHGVSVFRLPPLTLTAVIYKNDIMQMAAKIDEAHDNSLIFHHSSKPFTSQHGIFDSTTATRKRSESVIHAKRTTQKLRSVIPNININYTTEGPNVSPLAWLKNGINIQGHLMMWPSLEASSISVELDGLNSINFDLGLRKMPGYENFVPAEEQVNTAPNESDTEFLGQQNVSSATTSLDQVTTTERSFSFEDSTPTFSQNNATTDNIETIAFYDTATTDATSNFKAETEANTAQIPADKNTSHTRITDMNGMEHSHHSFNASYINPFSTQVKGNPFRYLLAQTIDEIHSDNAYVVDINMRVNGTESKTFTTFWTYAAGYNGGVHRFGFFLTEAARQIRFTSTLIASATPVMKLKDIIRSNTTASIHADMVYNDDGRECQLSLKTVMGHSAMKAESLDEEHLTDKCIDNYEGPKTDIDPRCLQAVMEAMFMDRYDVTVTYNDESKSFGPVVNQYYDYLRYSMWPYATDDIEDPTQEFAPANTITAVLEISPRLDNVNAWIRTPSRKTDFSNIPVNPMMTNILRYNPAVSYARRIRGESYCGHGGSKFLTFDGVEFDYNLTSCWHLLSKDCSGHSRIAILTRPGENKETEVEVNLDNYQIVHLSPGLNVSVNGQGLQLAENTVVEITDEAGTVLLQFEAAETPERLISVNMPAHGFRIIYTGSSTLIMADRRMRGRLCGICGDFNGDSVREFRKPEDNQARNSQEYASSYVVPSKECGRQSTYQN